MKRFADAHIHIRNSNVKEIRAMLDVVADKGVTDAALMALPYHSEIENLSAIYHKMTYRRMKLRAFGGIHFCDRYAGISPEKQAKELFRLGCDGIKMMDADPDVRRYIGYGLDNAYYDAFLSMMEEEGKPLLVHANQPEEFWFEGARERHFDGGYLSKQEIYDELFLMLDRHPHLKITFAHFFFLSNEYEEAVRVMESYPNVRFDLTPGWEMFLGFSKDIDRWRSFFIKYADRLLFGTDTNTYKDFNDKIHDLVYFALTHDESEFPMPAYRPNLNIRGLHLPEDVIERICYKNFIDFVGGEESAPVDEEYFEFLCRRVESDMETLPVYEEFVRANAEFGFKDVPSYEENCRRFFESVKAKI